MPAALFIASSLFLVVVVPTRPLIPVQILKSAVAWVKPTLTDRLDSIYGGFGTRWDVLESVRGRIPEGVSDIALFQNGDLPEVSLWRPFFRRHVVEFSTVPTREELLAKHVCWIIVQGSSLTELGLASDIDEFSQRWAATVVSVDRVPVKAHAAPEVFYTLSLCHGGETSSAKF